MLKFFRKYNKRILAIVTVLLMIAFLGGTAMSQLLAPRPGGIVIAHAYGEPVTQGDLQDISYQCSILDALQFQWRMPWGFGGDLAPLNEADYLLLVREARVRGGEPNRPQARAVLASRGQDLTEFRLQRQLSAADLEDAVANYLMVQRIWHTAQLSVQASELEVRQAVQDEHETINAELVAIQVEPLINPQQTFSEEEIEAQFQAHKDHLKSGEPFDFGYRIPDQVSLEYIRIDTQKIQPAKQITERMAERYWRENQTSFRKPLEPPPAPPALPVPPPPPPATPPAAPAGDAPADDSAPPSGDAPADPAAEPQAGEPQAEEAQGDEPAEDPAPQAEEPPGASGPNAEASMWAPQDPPADPAEPAAPAAPAAQPPSGAEGPPAPPVDPGPTITRIQPVIKPADGQPAGAPVINIKPPAPPVPYYETFAEARDKVMETLIEQARLEEARAMAEVIRRRLAEPWARVPASEGGFPEPPAEVKADSHYEMVVAELRDSLLHPDAVSVHRTGLFAVEEADKLLNIGPAMEDSQAGGVGAPLTSQLRRVQGLVEAPAERSRFEYLALYQTGRNPLRNPDDNSLYIYRVVQAVPSHSPESVQEVRDQVVEDLRRQAALDRATQIAGQIEGAAGQAGLKQAWEQFTDLPEGLEKSALGAWFEPVPFARSGVELYPGLRMPVTVRDNAGNPDLVIRSDDFVTKVYDLYGAEGAEALGTVQVPGIQKCFVVKLNGLNRLTAEEYAQHKQNAQRAVTRNNVEQLMQFWFSPDRIRARAGYTAAELLG